MMRGLCHGNPKKKRNEHSFGREQKALLPKAGVACRLSRSAQASDNSAYLVRSRSSSKWYLRSIDRSIDQGFENTASDVFDLKVTIMRIEFSLCPSWREHCKYRTFSSTSAFWPLPSPLPCSRQVPTCAGNGHRRPLHFVYFRIRTVMR